MWTIHLPSNDFWFALEKEDPGKVTNTALVESLDKLGTLNLKAIDTTLDSNQAEGLVHVVAPDKLDMEIIDVTHFDNWKIKELYFEEKEEFTTKDERNYVFWDKWVLVEKRKYIIKFYLFDSFGHRIRLINSMDFGFEFDKTIFNQIDWNSKNKPIFLVETL